MKKEITLKSKKLRQKTVIVFKKPLIENNNAETVDTNNASIPPQDPPLEPTEEKEEFNFNIGSQLLDFTPEEFFEKKDREKVEKEEKKSQEESATEISSEIQSEEITELTTETEFTTENNEDFKIGSKKELRKLKKQSKKNIKKAKKEAKKSNKKKKKEQAEKIPLGEKIKRKLDSMIYDYSEIEQAKAEIEAEKIVNQDGFYNEVVPWDSDEDEENSSRSKINANKPIIIVISLLVIVTLTMFYMIASTF